MPNTALSHGQIPLSPATPGHPGAPRIDALTGIRAVAALWVVGFHFLKGPLEPLHLDDALPMLRYGYLGVDLFFLLSGFIISHVHQAEMRLPSAEAIWRFYGLRLARMYPVHLLVLCGLAALVLGGSFVGMAPAKPEDFRFADFVYNLFLVQSWGFAADIHWNFPAWSISCEWLVYLLFPLLALGTNRIVSRCQAVFWLALETGLFALAYVFFFGCDLDNKFDGENFSRFALARVCFEFTLGALCYRLTNFVPMRAWPWTAILAVALSLAIVLAPTRARDLTVIAAFALAILAAAQSRNLLSRILRLAPVVYFGDISYSLYMVHAPMRMTLGKLLAPRIAAVGASASGWSLGLGLWLATIAAAALSYHWVEVPARRRLRLLLLQRLNRSRHTASNTAEAGKIAPTAARV